MDKNLHDPYRATFQLTIEDLSEPSELTYAMYALNYEVWRYVPNVGFRTPYLPRDYVEMRLVEQLAGDIPQEEKQKLIKMTITKLIDLGYLDICPAIGYLLVRRCF